MDGNMADIVSELSKINANLETLSNYVWYVAAAAALWGILSSNHRKVTIVKED